MIKAVINVRLTSADISFSRIAQGGRNWEGFGADPFLSGESAYETILGMQEGGVQACAKHYINKYVRCCFVSRDKRLTSFQRATTR